MKKYPLILCLSVLATAPAVRADEVKDACVSAYEQSQLARRNGDLARARQELRACARAACPSLVRNDCVTWLDQVESSFPSVVIRAERDGADVSDVHVTVDGKSFVARLDGKAIEIAPGEHVFRFELDGVAPQTQTVTVREGEKARTIAVRFPSAHPVAPAVEGDVAGSARPTPAGVYLLGGLSLAGLATFGVFASIGKSDESSLRNSCAPTCSASSVDAIRSKFLVGDVGLGVGVASLAAAAVWYVLRPTQHEQPPPVDVVATDRGASLVLRQAF